MLLLSHIIYSEPMSLKRIKQVGTILTAVLLLTLALLFHRRAMRLVQPPRLPLQHTPADFGIETWEDVVITAVDHISLAGWYIPPDKNGLTLIYLHGLGSNRDSMLPQAAMLARHGYGALLLDLRAHGASGGDKSTWGMMEAEDVKTAVATLQSRPETQQIGLIGHSMGGAIAIRTASQLPDIHLLVVESSYTRLADNSQRLAVSFARVPEWLGPMTLWWAQTAAHITDPAEPISDLQHVSQPILFTHGLADGTIWAQNTDVLLETAVSPIKSRTFIANGDHQNFYTINPTEFEQTLLQFLTDN
jgi:pimeloyl-ACP methyl ester carboxylesterase